MGPTLYLLYTNDIPEPQISTIATFADDTAILTVADTEEIANHNLQQVNNEIKTWSTAWRIKLNHKKSVHTNFTNKTTQNLPVYMDNLQMPYSNNASI